MQLAELAARLVAASDADREALLRENSALANAALAHLLKDICLEGWSTHSTQALAAAGILKLLTRLRNDPEIAALSAWTSGLGALIHGDMEQAVEKLDQAQAGFLGLGDSHTAAATQVSKLIALAMLGRYDQAIDCGRRALEVLLAHNDLLVAGKIEHNIGNIYFRRDQYPEAEEFQRAARQRFNDSGDQSQITKIENSLALTLSAQHKIREAEELYELALARAQDANQIATQAAIESSIGTLALYQGRYDRALDYLERSRRKYAELNMPHFSAMTEQEIADSYLDLNLAPEAAEIYQRVTETFAELGMRAEEARALLYNGRAAISVGQHEKAHQLLARARELYSAECNAVGAALVRLTEAQLLHAEGNYAGAGTAAKEAHTTLAAAGTLRLALVAQWLIADCARAQSKFTEAKTLLNAALSEATSQEQPDIAAQCCTGLGLLAELTGEVNAATGYFKQSIALIEGLRAPLRAEEFRTAFFANKLAPYQAMVRVSLGNGNISEALGFVEQARSRALADAVGGSVKLTAAPRDQFEADLLAQLDDLRHELNYFYNQIHRPVSDARHGETGIRALHDALREREKKVLEIMRQLQHRGEKTSIQIGALDIAALQNDLGLETVLVEYTTIADELLAFVVTEKSIEVVRALGSESRVSAELSQLRFQIDTLRHGSESVRRHLPELNRRARRRLESLYDVLLRPLEGLIGRRRLVIVPHRTLHYLPFQALHDGTNYLLEGREISYAPSALVLQQCLHRDQATWNTALLLGVADEQTPRVRDEIKALTPLFPEAVALLDGEATVAALRKLAPNADVVHLACHGQFRPDSPLFSSLKLGDGWLSVRDAYGLQLHCSLVTLSACETGVSSVAPGDELIGLTRGFFAAGSPSLLLSLWTVDDNTTAELMTEFYKHLRESGSPAAALRHAQLRVMETKPHPFFWSPFVLVGRW